MNRLLRRSLLIGCIVLGGGVAVLLAVARPAIEPKAEASPRRLASESQAAFPQGAQGDADAKRKPNASEKAHAPRLAAAVRVEPLWEAYAPETAQQADEAPSQGLPQSGISTDALLKVLEKFSEVAKTQQSAAENASQAPEGPSLPIARPADRAPGPAPKDVEVLKPEEVLKMAEEGDDLPPPKGSPQHSPSQGEAVITHVPGYSEGDEHLEIHIQDEDLRKVLALLSEQGGLNILAGPSVQGTTVSASLKDVSVDSALDAILRSTGYVAQRSGKFIYVGTPQDFEMMKQSADRIGVRVYRPNYVTAKDLSALLTPLLSAAPVGKISLSAPAEAGIAPQSNTAGGDALSESEAVVVQDYEAVLKEIDQVVKEIDKRPPQVCIQAMILSVQLNDQNQMGIDFQLLRSQQNLRFGLGSPRTAPLDGSGQMDQNGNTIGAYSFANGGMNLAFLDGNLGAFFAFLETIGDTNVIATPKVLCLNKQRAEIQIGEQLGYVTTTLTSTSTAQTINFLDTGAQLRLRPFISDDGLIRLEVHPELSTGKVVQQGNFTLPNKQVTQVTTNIMVRDGCTVVIGGLMREDLQTDINQVPLMGSLPWIGPLFRHKTEKMSRVEILVLLTPRLVQEPESDIEATQGADEFILRQNVVRDHTNPIARRYLGRKALRKAQAALAAGDRATAVRMGEKAVFYDPENQQAIEFRERMRSGGPAAPAMPPLPPNPAQAALDGEEIAPWLLEGLGGGPAIPPPPPRDLGQPGRIVDIERQDMFDEPKK